MRRLLLPGGAAVGAILIGACTTATPSSAPPSQAQPSLAVPSGAASPSAAAREPICLDPAMPAWFTELAKNRDDRPDPAGRIVFGSITRYDVAGQVLGALYAIDPDGTDAVRILTCHSERPRISPDGTRLAFSVVMTDGSWQIATAAIDGTGLEILTATHGYAQWPDWMPDGRSIVFAQSDEICDEALDCANVVHTLWQMDIDGANKRRIGEQLRFVGEPRVSPDGTELLFDRYDPVEDVNAFTIMTLATGELRRVTMTNTTDITHPDWSRDGGSVIYNTNGDGTNGIGQQVEVVPADDPTAPPVKLFGDVQHDAFKPAYSPDGSRIVFGCGLPICLMDADGSNLVTLVSAPGVELNHPAWGVSLAGD